MTEARACRWCGQPMPATSRRDALTCSKRCRQSRWRFDVAPAGAATLRPMRFAYADPPYPGLARRYYASAEVNHPLLIAYLCEQWPDGWALSTSSDALRDVLLMCPPSVRVCSWHRGERRGRSHRPRDAWEPLIVCGGRARVIEPQESCCNALAAAGKHRSHPGRLVGMKPPAFSRWMFAQLGAMVGDELEDVFPGSGSVSRAWALYQGRAA